MVWFKANNFGTGILIQSEDPMKAASCFVKELRLPCGSQDPQNDGEIGTPPRLVVLLVQRKRSGAKFVRLRRQTIQV